MSLHIQFRMTLVLWILVSKFEGSNACNHNHSGAIDMSVCNLCMVTKGNVFIYVCESEFYVCT